MEAVVDGGRVFMCSRIYNGDGITFAELYVPPEGLKWAGYAPAPSDEVAVGDLNSMEKGSGARKNAGKARLDLVPVSFWKHRWLDFRTVPGPELEVMDALDAFQRGNDQALAVWLASSCPTEWYDEAVKVLEFGAEKYAAWNWACGMDWSVCIGCILRHMKAIVDGESIDPESGLHHYGHVVCNVIFLAYFVDHYPEGDDRPPRYKS